MEFWVCKHSGEEAWKTPQWRCLKLSIASCRNSSLQVMKHVSTSISWLVHLDLWFRTWSFSSASTSTTSELIPLLSYWCTPARTQGRGRKCYTTHCTIPAGCQWFPCTASPHRLFHQPPKKFGHEPPWTAIFLLTKYWDVDRKRGNSRTTNLPIPEHQVSSISPSSSFSSSKFAISSKAFHHLCPNSQILRLLRRTGQGHTQPGILELNLDNRLQPLQLSKLSSWFLILRKVTAKAEGFFWEKGCHQTMTKFDCHGRLPNWLPN